jgi:hypothetical protein
MTPEETFMSDLSIITHTYILECRKKSIDIAKELSPIIIALLEAEIEFIKEIPTVE